MPFNTECNNFILPYFKKVFTYVLIAHWIILLIMSVQQLYLSKDAILDDCKGIWSFVLVNVSISTLGIFAVISVNIYYQKFQKLILGGTGELAILILCMANFIFNIVTFHNAMNNKKCKDMWDGEHEYLWGIFIYGSIMNFIIYAILIIIIVIDATMYFAFNGSRFSCNCCNRYSSYETI